MGSCSRHRLPSMTSHPSYLIYTTAKREKRQTGEDRRQCSVLLRGLNSLVSSESKTSIRFHLRCTLVPNKIHLVAELRSRFRCNRPELNPKRKCSVSLDRPTLVVAPDYYYHIASTSSEKRPIRVRWGRLIDSHDSGQALSESLNSLVITDRGTAF